MPEEPTVENDGERAVVVDKSRAPLAVVAVCALAMVPIVYLALSKRPIHAASKTTPQAAVASPTAPNVGMMEAAVARDPSPANRLNLSLAYIDSNQPARAKPVLNALLGQDPANVAGWNNLCVAQVMLRELKDAIDDCSHALSIDGSYQLARNNLKWAEDLRQEELDAVNTMERTGPGDRDAAFFINEGTHFLHLGDYSKAIDAWQRAILIDPHNAIAANNIGTALMLEKEPVVAMTWFAKAADWDPALQIVKNNMIWAQQEIDTPRHGH